MTGEFQSVNDYVPDHLSTTPMDVLSFWFSEESRPKWFATDPSFDAAVSARYGEVLQAAKRGELFSGARPFAVGWPKSSFWTNFRGIFTGALLPRSSVTRRLWRWHRRLSATGPDWN